MTQRKTKIVLDADVIIHFSKAGTFNKLPEILPEYQYIILDVVYNEATRSLEQKKLLDNSIYFFKKINIEKFSPTGDSKKEYFNLLQSTGKGESACMIYCRDNQDVLGSSNIKDVQEYCSEHNITYLTTVDFLYYAFVRGVLTADECDDFIKTVRSNGSKLPDINIRTYICNKQL